MSKLNYKLTSEKKFLDFARNFAQSLTPGITIGFSGPLGVGKTTFIRGLVGGLAKGQSDWVQSPTFTLMNLYHSQPPVVHLDLYRYRQDQQIGAELEDIGLRDHLDGNQIILFEWIDRLDENFLRPDIRVDIAFIPHDENARQITLWACTDRGIPSLRGIGSPPKS